MLKDLKIINGDMSLKFDSLNTIYTINLTEDADVLKFQYEISENDKISIMGNDLKAGVNEVVLTVYNDEESMSYYLYVYKEEMILANSETLSGMELNISGKEEISSYALPTISVVCFITILLFFTLLFKKKKN